MKRNSRLKWSKRKKQRRGECWKSKQKSSRNAMKENRPWRDRWMKRWRRKKRPISSTSNKNSRSKRSCKTYSTVIFEKWRSKIKKRKRSFKICNKHSDWKNSNAKQRIKSSKSNRPNISRTSRNWIRGYRQLRKYGRRRKKPKI